MPFCIDTSSLIEAWRYYPPQRFASLWHNFEALVAAGRLMSPDAALMELAQQDDGIYKWAKQHPRLFHAHLPNIQATVAQIMSEFQTLVDPNAPTIGADPFLVALAKLYGACVVTQERPGSHLDPKIPFVCKHYGVQCCKLLGMMEKEGWLF